MNQTADETSIPYLFTSENLLSSVVKSNLSECVEYVTGLWPIHCTPLSTADGHNKMNPSSIWIPILCALILISTLAMALFMFFFLHRVQNQQSRRLCGWCAQMICCCSSIKPGNNTVGVLHNESMQEPPTTLADPDPALPEPLADPASKMSTTTPRKTRLFSLAWTSSKLPLTSIRRNTSVTGTGDASLNTFQQFSQQTCHREDSIRSQEPLASSHPRNCRCHTTRHSVFLPISGDPNDYTLFTIPSSPRPLSHPHNPFPPQHFSYVHEEELYDGEPLDGPYLATRRCTSHQFPLFNPVTSASSMHVLHPSLTDPQVSTCDFQKLSQSLSSCHKDFMAVIDVPDISTNRHPIFGSQFESFVSLFLSLDVDTLQSVDSFVLDTFANLTN